MNIYMDQELDERVWYSGSSTDDESSRSALIAVSGNTGAGKSTLINIVAKELEKHLRRDVIALNERHFHHPLLRKMFENPKEYAFGIQLNFLLQRYLCLKNLLMSGFVVMSERSHYDDMLFLEHHFDQNNISTYERKLYSELSEHVRQQLPIPDIWLLLDVSPVVSRKRIDDAEANGERPKEFPNDIIKQEFIDSWYKKYNKFFRYLKDQISSNALFKDSTYIAINSSMQSSEENYLKLSNEIVDILTAKLYNPPIN